MFACVRLAHKYQIEDVLEQGLNALQEYYATTLSNWHNGNFRFSPQNAIGAVALARLTDTPSILPAALYTCSVLGKRVLDGWTREDGSVEHLSSEDAKRCIGGREELLRRGVAAVITIVMEGISPHCLNPSSCHSVAHRDLMDFGRNDPGSFGQVSWQIEKFARTRCQKCKTRMATLEEEWREGIWTDLAQIFDVTVEA